ncbi:hypothetical protein KLEP181_gp49 [Paracoccus phage vB_PmaP_KLEP18-1]|nr:hypothetical protein KLEP181_gp49 [Paracoccus phage vB_PmaP_KLEP18-1]
MIGAGTSGRTPTAVTLQTRLMPVAVFPLTTYGTPSGHYPQGCAYPDCRTQRFCFRPAPRRPSGNCPRVCASSRSAGALSAYPRRFRVL